MGEQPSPVERRRTLRAPVRGVAVHHAAEGPLHGALENLSRGGALVNIACAPSRTREGLAEETHELELRLSEGCGWVVARTVRLEPAAKRWRLAVSFDRVDATIGAAIDAAIGSALSAAARRAILVIDDRADRRASLIDRLSNRGMTPLAPRTPLEAIELLTRTQLHVSVVLLAPGFGVASAELAALLADSFPWVTTTEITDDLEATTGRAVDAWAETPIARLSGPIPILKVAG
jgi:hypothetical protein